ERQVDGGEVLRPHEAISAEHEGPVHIEEDNREARKHSGGIAQSVIRKTVSAPDVLPNGSRLSCGALKRDSFRNLRAPPASSACWAAPTTLVVDVKVKDKPLDVPGRTRTVRAGHDFNLRVIRSDESGSRLVKERRYPVGLCVAADLTSN